MLPEYSFLHPIGYKSRVIPLDKIADGLPHRAARLLLLIGYIFCLPFL